MESFVWSLDISTTNIGTALWDKNENLIELKHLELKVDKNIKPENRDIYKAEVFKKHIIEYNEKVKSVYGGEIKFIVVEEPLGGSNNQNTVSLLFGFNGMCRYNLYDVFNLYPIKISVYESRKAFCPELLKEKKVKGVVSNVLSFPEEYKNRKKEYIWEKVKKMEPNIKWFYVEKGKNIGSVHSKSFDMSDAYCVGKSAFKLFNLTDKLK